MSSRHEQETSDLGRFLKWGQALIVFIALSSSVGGYFLLQDRSQRNEKAITELRAEVDARLQKQSEHFWKFKNDQVEMLQSIDKRLCAICQHVRADCDGCVRFRSTP